MSGARDGGQSESPPEGQRLPVGSGGGRGAFGARGRRAGGGWEGGGGGQSRCGQSSKVTQTFRDVSPIQEATMWVLATCQQRTTRAVWGMGCNGVRGDVWSVG